MAGLLSGFLQSMKHTCRWSMKMGNDEWGKPVWAGPSLIPCIFFPEKKIIDGKTGGVYITPANFYIKPTHGVAVGDRIEFRGQFYVIESMSSIDWFGGIHDGYKCSCRQEGGVAP